MPDYILKLKDSGLFHTVNYTGYDYDNEWYTLSLSCVMGGKVSEQAQKEGITLEMKNAQGVEENQNADEQLPEGGTQ